MVGSNSPVGTAASSNQQLNYIEADHLNTPRVVIEPDRNVAIWSWDIHGEAFGASQPNEDPDGDGKPFTLDLRFPGQRYDSATGLYQNDQRDYDPKTGRYLQSDPIGLEGGINTYSYSANNPFSLIDPNGLNALVIVGGVRDGSFNIFGHVANAVTNAGLYSYGNSNDLGSSVLNYIQRESTYREQYLFFIPTTLEQDSKMLSFYSHYPERNDVGIVDNCAMRTESALFSAGLKFNVSPFEIPTPIGLSLGIMDLPGVKLYTVPQGGNLSAELKSVIAGFEKTK